MEKFERMVIYVLINKERREIVQRLAALQFLWNGLAYTDSDQVSGTNDGVEMNHREKGGPLSRVPNKPWLHNPHTSVLVGFVTNSVEPVHYSTRILATLMLEAEEEANPTDFHSKEAMRVVALVDEDAVESRGP